MPVQDTPALRPSLPPACSPFICAIKLFLSPHAGPSLLTNWGEGHGSRAGRGGKDLPRLGGGMQASSLWIQKPSPVPWLLGLDPWI